MNAAAPVIGLTSQQAQVRLRQYGPNELIEKGARGPLKIVLAQFSSTIVLLLILSTFISGFLGDVENAVAIGAIVVLNAMFGFIQENRAEKALSALKKMASPIVKVRRDGRLLQCPSHQVVPGDVVILETGNIIPADGIVAESVNLRVLESALTGESDAVEKRAASEDTRQRPLAERFNMIHAGTVVVYGRGLMIVTDTGMRTELGHIAAMIQSVPSQSTPLQIRLDHLGRRLVLAAVGIVAVIFGLGVARGEELRNMFLTAVSVAVAAVPEGLSAIVTINLAFGARRMLKRHALIRQLPAVETLGSVTAICTDKTGTLTENKMTVAFCDVADHEMDMADLRLDGSSPHVRQTLSPLVIAGALCNDSELEADPANSSGFRAIGDPTENALAMAAVRFGFHKARLEKDYPRVAELPFDSVRKRMSTLHHVIHATGFPAAAPASRIIFTKGSVDSLLDVSNQVMVGDMSQPLSDVWRERIRSAQDKLAQRGMRVLGVSFRWAGDADSSFEENQMTFVGLFGLMDPLRREVKEAVNLCLAAGIKPVMITGDHPLTAQAIARELGFDEAPVLTGVDLERMSVEELEAIVDRTSVYARVSPEHKLRIVQALQKKGNVVAMTGDGVNDAPALKKADIGVAMGVSGTDVAKEASSMVLLDDNFATIVLAVKEGRVIYDNIRKFLRYLLIGNVGEIWLMFLAPLLGMPMPLLPIQILWINLITDGLPALALGVEPASRTVMRRPPVSPSENIFAQGMGRQIMRLGLVVGTVPLGVGLWYWNGGDSAWQTMVFTTLIFTHVLMAFAFRSQHDSFFRLPAFSNKALVGAVALSIVLQIFVVYTPALQTIFKTVSLSARELFVCLILGTSVFWLAEAEKRFRQRSAS